VGAFDSFCQLANVIIFIKKGKRPAGAGKESTYGDQMRDAGRCSILQRPAIRRLSLGSGSR
jgi:hypothetical protein